MTPPLCRSKNNSLSPAATGLSGAVGIARGNVEFGDDICGRARGYAPDNLRTIDDGPANWNTDRMNSGDAILLPCNRHRKLSSSVCSPEESGAAR